MKWIPQFCLVSLFFLFFSHREKRTHLSLLLSPIEECHPAIALVLQSGERNGSEWRQTALAHQFNILLHFLEEKAATRPDHERRFPLCCYYIMKWNIIKNGILPRPEEERQSEAMAGWGLNKILWCKQWMRESSSHHHHFHLISLVVVVVVVV